MAFLLAAAAPASASEDASLTGWTELSSTHLTLITDGDEVPARQLLRSLEIMRSTLLELGLRPPEPTHLPTTIVLFTRPSAYEPFALHERAGQFFATPYENLIAVDATVRSRPAAVIASHEYVHALLFESGLSVPLWLNEGLAEYYSTLRLEDSRVILGEAPRRHRRRLRGHAFLSFDQLFGLESQSGEYLDHENAARFYAQSWLLVHYLLADTEVATHLPAYLDGFASGLSSAEAFQRAYGLRHEVLNGQLRRYLNRSRLPSYETALAGGSASPRIDARALPPAEAALALGLLVAEQTKWLRTPQRVALAQLLLGRAGRGTPQDGDVVAAQAYLASTLGDSPRAASLYQRALYLDAREARSYALYARFLLDRAADRPTAGTAEQARLAVTRALEIAPEHQGLRALQAGLLPW